MPGRAHVEQEVGDAPVLRRVGVGAGEQDPAVAEVRARRPHLLPVDDPLVAVAHGPGGSPARSEPAPGSLNSWHHTSSPRSIGGRKRCFCSSVPWAMIVGPAMPMPTANVAPNAPKLAVLLGEDRRLARRATTSAVLVRPGDARPAFVGEELLPHLGDTHPVEPVIGSQAVEVGDLPDHARLRQPVADLRSEGRVLGTLVKVHAAF